MPFFHSIWLNVDFTGVVSAKGVSDFLAKLIDRLFVFCYIYFSVLFLSHFKTLIWSVFFNSFLFCCCKVVSDFAKFNVHDPESLSVSVSISLSHSLCECVCLSVCRSVCLYVCLPACLSVCVSLASGSSETAEVIIIKLDMVTASDMVMHYGLTILTVTFIQSHTYLIMKINVRLFQKLFMQSPSRFQWR